MVGHRSKTSDTSAPAARRPIKTKSPEDPGWANGLRNFYSSVVEEPLPDAFSDLLRKLEDGEPPATGKGAKR